MRSLLIMLSLVFAISTTMPLKAQNEKQLSKRELKKLEKKKKKEAEEKAEYEDFLKIKRLIDDTTFVFVADRLYGERGRTFNLNSSLNFLIVNKKEGSYQFSFHGISGWNGLGGATFNGDITKYEVKYGKNFKKPTYVSMIFRPRGVGGLPYINITSYGSKAIMDLTLDNGTRIRLDGEIKPIGEADILKGHSIF